jgi:hypothetical protein
MAFSESAKIAADAKPDRLEPIAESGPWKVYEVAGTSLVTSLPNQPAVLDDIHQYQHDWLPVAAALYNDPDSWAVLRAASGPDEWQRVPSTATPEERPAEPVEVSDIRADEDSISFTVDQVGVPVLVKASYFPNWTVDGAEGPYRVMPNLMVVVPTSEEVTLSYGQTPVDVFAWLLTFLGLAGLAILAWRPPLAMNRLRRRAHAEGAVGEGLLPGAPPDGNGSADGFGPEAGPDGPPGDGAPGGGPAPPASSLDGDGALAGAAAGALLVDLADPPSGQGRDGDAHVAGPDVTPGPGEAPAPGAGPGDGDAGPGVGTADLPTTAVPASSSAAAPTSDDDATVPLLLPGAAEAGQDAAPMAWGGPGPAEAAPATEALPVTAVGPTAGPPADSPAAPVVAAPEAAEVITAPEATAADATAPEAPAGEATPAPEAADTWQPPVAAVPESWLAPGPTPGTASDPASAPPASAPPEPERPAPEPPTPEAPDETTGDATRPEANTAQSWLNLFSPTAEGDAADVAWTDRDEPERDDSRPPGSSPPGR